MKDYFFSCIRNTFAFWRSMNKFSDFYEFLMIQMATPPFSNLPKKCILLFILLLEYITMKLLMVHFDLIICQDVIGLSSCRFRIYKFDAFFLRKVQEIIFVCIYTRFYNNDAYAMDKCRIFFIILLEVITSTQNQIP